MVNDIIGPTTVGPTLLGDLVPEYLLFTVRRTFVAQVLCRLCGNPSVDVQFRPTV